MNYIDTHAHYDDDKFSEDLEEVIKCTKEVGIKAIINDSIDVENSKNVIKLARKFENMFVAIGIHPTEYGEDNYIEKLEKLYNENKDIIVAIGEIGLDYYWEKDNRIGQHKKFLDQIELANKLRLPIVIHCRDAGDEIVKLMKKCMPKYGCVFHCYQPNDETKRFIIENDFYISLTGNITFKRNEYFHKVINEISIDRIMLETDCPYMSPEPFRGKRNSSVNIPIMAKKLAEIKEIDEEKAAEIVYNNSVRFYNLQEKIK